jgi:uncharacterized protein YbjT (DUF2867 family)
MKFVVIGGTGLIGRNVVAQLREQGHEAVSAAPSSGVNAVTGEGLAQAFAGAQVVVDASNSPSFEDAAVLEFFRASAQNIVAAARAAGVRHLVALSVVGTDRMQASGYFRAKLLQESLLQASGLPYTIVRATQFYEFIAAIADFSTSGNTVRVQAANFQPMAARDVSRFVADCAQGAPANGTVEIGGPDTVPLALYVSRWLHARGDRRAVVAAADANYFGVDVGQGELVAGPAARLGRTGFEDWLRANAL